LPTSSQLMRRRRSCIWLRKGMLWVCHDVMDVKIVYKLQTAKHWACCSPQVVTLSFCYLQVLC
jgi:hypothetical protein